MTRILAAALLSLFLGQDADLEKVLTAHKDLWFSLAKDGKKVGYIRWTSAKETVDGQAVWRFRDTYMMKTAEGAGTIVQETVVKQNEALELVSAAQTFTMITSPKLRDLGFAEKAIFETSAKIADGKIKISLVKTEGIPEKSEGLCVESLRKELDRTEEGGPTAFAGGAFVRKLWMLKFDEGERSEAPHWTWILPAEDDAVKKGPVFCEGKDDEGRFILKSRNLDLAVKADRTIAALRFWGAVGTPSDDKAPAAVE